MRGPEDKRTVDRRMRTRIIGLCEGGMTHTAIAKRVGVSRQTVVKWCTRFAECGTVEDAHRPGRPPKQTRQLIKQVEKALRGKRGTSVRKVQAKLKSQGTTVGRMTVSRAAHAAGLRPYARRVKPLLTDAAKRKRRSFARRERDRDWRRVIAADEATIYVFDTPNRRHDIVWARPGEPIPAFVRRKASAKWNLFGAIARSGTVVLTIFDERFTKECYVDILALELLPAAEQIFNDDNWCLLHDKSPQHTSHLAQQWLDTHVPEHMSSIWPPSSPDLNPMENVWAVVRDRARAHAPTTKQQLRHAIQAAWDSIDTNTTRTLMDSMPQRLRNVTRAKGSHTTY